jgi:hypothetical protein
VEMRFRKSWFFYGMLILVTGCNILKKNSGIELENGLYRTKSSQTTQKVYVIFEDSIVNLYSLNKNTSPNTPATRVFEFNDRKEKANSLRLKQSSLDIDIFTIPFKYRPAVVGFPNQLNTNFSGAVYLGFRTDNYHFTYLQTPLQYYQRKLNHFGYSIGLFSGFGSTAMNSWVTQNGVVSEYDGLVVLSGIATIIAVSKLTFGLGLGVDHLLDKNKDTWIYQGKSWIGLTVGLNLN